MEMIIVIIAAFVGLIFFGFLTSVAFGISPLIVPAFMFFICFASYIIAIICGKYSSWLKIRKQKAHDEMLRDEALRQAINQAIPTLYTLAEKTIRYEISGYSGGKSALELICRDDKSSVRNELVYQYSALKIRIRARYE